MIALLDSGATENFLNLTYARWLKIPIKRLPSSRTLLNVDGTENRSGRLEYYTDLQVRTGNDITKATIFPIRPRRTQSHTRISMVCRSTTKNRLEERMD